MILQIEVEIGRIKRKDLGDPFLCENLSFRIDDLSNFVDEEFQISAFASEDRFSVFVSLIENCQIFNFHCKNPLSVV